jgi:hypothetical protein
VYYIHPKANTFVAEPNDFSRSFILLFRAYDKLFLNSFGYLRAQVCVSRSCV